jgi:hypothetical protein
VLTLPSIGPIINYHVYRRRVLGSVFDELQEQVTKVRLIANEAKRWADGSTTAERGEDEVVGMAADE